MFSLFISHLVCLSPLFIISGILVILSLVEGCYIILSLSVLHYHTDTAVQPLVYDKGSYTQSVGRMWSIVVFGVACVIFVTFCHPVWRKIIMSSVFGSESFRLV